MIEGLETLHIGWERQPKKAEGGFEPAGTMSVLAAWFASR